MTQESIQLKRAYDEVEEADGYRILVERLWPRGVKKEALHCQLWAKEMAPSKELRQWYQHDTAKFPEFQERYLAELANNPAKEKFLQTVQEALAEGPVTFVFSSKEERYNSASVLKAWVESQS